MLADGKTVPEFPTRSVGPVLKIPENYIPPTVIKV